MATALAVREYEEDDQVSAAIRQHRILDAARVIIGRLDKECRQCVSAKQPIEQRWIRNIRQYLGQYAPDKHALLVAADQSTAFVKLTRHKTNGWSARIGDLLFPTDNKNWGMSPTPIPKLSGEAKEAAAAAIAKVQEANQAAEAGDPTAEQIAAEAGQFAEVVRNHYAAIEEAKRRAEWMERTIEDQLVESDYVTECRDVIEDGCKLGTGILKGPMTVQSLQPRWSEAEIVLLDANKQPVRNRDGTPQTKKSWELQQAPDPRPMFKRVNPWFFYPDPSATNVKEAEFTFELSLPSQKDLKRSARKLGFNREAVARLLEEGPPQTPDTVLVHLAEVRALTGESEDIRNRYLQWEYNGPLECDEICALLRAMGKDEEAARFEEEKDEFEEYRVIIHFIGNEVLKIAPEYPLDSGDGLYSVWCFEKSEASIFGYGVPEIMSDSQDSLNNAWRMMQDNGALSVGPQLVFDKGAIEPQPGEGWGLKPLKVWLRTSAAYASAQNRPFDVFNIPNNQQELAGIIELAKAFADEESSMPDIAQGEQGAASTTMGGMSMLFNSANVMFRRVVKSWDDELTKPTLRRAFDWNMQFNPDESIKGDMQAEARGSSVLLVREIQSQNLMAIATNWPVHPKLGIYIKERDILVKTLQTMMIPPEDVLRTQEEVDKLLAEQAQQSPAPDPVMEMRLQVAQVESQTRLNIAQMQIDLEVAKIAQATDQSVAEVKAKYEIEEKKIGSTERMTAAKMALEEQRRQAGIDPGQGVG